ncbi:MAG TPA: Hpt domain-containing protein, partial [Kofleriaceae bacterium]|nr:Hpt domain-containing protein [Kofleriaceae bacterium]
METGFTIDDVRETLTRDVTRSLGRIEQAARAILDDRELAVDGEPAGLPRFQVIGDQNHAIYGTARLVAAHSLADSSARMEALAHHGRDQLSRALRHLAVVRDIAAAMVGGSTDMLAMLSLELDGQSHEAQTIADSWRLRVEDVLQDSALVIAGAESVVSNLRVVEDGAEPRTGSDAREAPRDGGRDGARDEVIDNGWDDVEREPARLPALPLIPPPPPADRGYSFATSLAEDPVDDTSVIDPDLVEVFAEEAAATLDALDTALGALAASRDDRAVLKAVERGFHTLKGASATVGLAEVSERAAELQDRAELLVDTGRAVTGDEVAALIRDAAALRELAGIPAAPSLGAAPPTAATAPAVPLRAFGDAAFGDAAPSLAASLAEARAVFMVEAREV